MAEKTISLPPDLARRLEEIAETEGKSVSAVVQDALRLASREYLKQQYTGIQGYWSRSPRERHPDGERSSTVSRRLKVVSDTNIFISAFVLPESQASAAMARIIDGVDDLVISKPIIDELLGVLARKLSRDADELARVAVLLTDLA